MTDFDTNPVDALALAKQHRAEREHTLPALRHALEQAAATRDRLSAVLDEHEGDALIGRCDDKRLTRARERHNEAVIEHKKAAALLRQAEDEIARLDETIARLTPEALQVRLTHYHDRQAELARELRRKLELAQVVNDELHALYAEAEREFPWVTQRGGGRPFPPAAGLTDLSWFELRHNPHATSGGRFGAWCVQVENFLNPPPPPAPRKRRDPVAAKATERTGSWHPLPVGER